MVTVKWAAICQYCGRKGSLVSNNGDKPRCNPTIPGKCPAHPSGKPNMNHSPRWERY